MLPSLGFQEIVLLGILALVFIGPKDLPLMLRKLGRWTAKLRGMAQEFRSGFDELARQAELDELKREVDALRKTTNLQDIGRELSQPLTELKQQTDAYLAPPGVPSTPPPAVADPAPVDEAPALAAPEAQPEPAPAPEPEIAHDEPMARSVP